MDRKRDESPPASSSTPSSSFTRGIKYTSHELLIHIWQRVMEFRSDNGGEFTGADRCNFCTTILLIRENVQTLDAFALYRQPR
jgi:hypothetical protein